MSTLPTRSAQTIVSNIASGMQGRIDAFLNFAVGKVFRALAEAVMGVALWLQSEALRIVKLTRLSTSFGTDVDTFVADFPLVTRFGAEAATGQVTLGRYTALTSPSVIPVGATVKTASGVLFAVVADTTNASYSASSNGYVLPPQITAVNVTVQAVVPGSAGNVAAGSITLPDSGLSGISLVSNANAFTNGIDSESDDALKARFQLAILGRSGGTRYAIRSAIANVKAGMQCQILEFQDYSGTFDPAMNTVIVDDGSGAISDDLYAACITAVSDSEAGARACGIQVGVYKATTTLVNIIMQVQTAAGYDHNVALAQLDQALSLYINSMGLGVGLGYFDLPDVAKTVSGITRVLSYTLNGGTTDIAASPYTTLKIGQATLS